MSKNVEDFSLKNNKICIKIDICSKHFLAVLEHISFKFAKTNKLKLIDILKI